MNLKSYNKTIRLIEGKLEVISNTPTPIKLYKYYSVNKYSLDNLQKNTLHFSHPYSLNDIMDGNFQLWDLNDFINEYKKDIKKPSLSNEELTKDFYHTLSEEFLKNIGVLSLATNFNNDLFWPHYTSEEGFCIEFNSDILIKSLPKEDFHSFPISYEELKPINFNDNIIKEVNGSKVDIDANVPIFYSLSFKDKIWEYENEWRFLLKSKLFEKVSHKLRIIDDKAFEEEDYNKKLRNIPYERNSIDKIILSTLFFNNTRFNSVTDKSNFTIYHFKKEDSVFFEFLKELFTNYNDSIYQLDKIYNDKFIERKLNCKIQILELTKDYLKVKKYKYLLKI